MEFACGGKNLDSCTDLSLVGKNLADRTKCGLTAEPVLFACIQLLMWHVNKNMFVCTLPFPLVVSIFIYWCIMAKIGSLFQEVLVLTHSSCEYT